MDDMKMPLSERLSIMKHRIKRKTRFFIGSRLPDAAIEWNYLDGMPVPVCPRCGDYVYYKNQCTQCGQHFLPGAETIGGVLSARAETVTMAKRR